jgi:hypothetical protein
MKINISDGAGRPTQVSVAPTLAFALLAVFACVTFGAFQLKDDSLFKTLAQGLLNIIIAIAAYYWDSSQGSRAKDDAIAAVLENNKDISK